MIKTPAIAALYLYSYCDCARAWLHPPVPGLHRGLEADRLRATLIRRPIRIAEAFLWLLAIAGIGGSLLTYTSAYIHQHRQLKRLKSMTDVTGVPPSSSSPSLKNASAFGSANQVTHDDLLGILEIPRLGISSVVEQGVDDGTLALAIGHIPGTRYPGEVGNIGLAAHRDTYFRHLEDVKSGDDIIFNVPGIKYIYKVEGTQIVDPSDTSILSDSNGNTLTLVTCFPFHYIGPAPKRFIVTATLAEDSPTAPKSDTSAVQSEIPTNNAAL